MEKLLFAAVWSAALLALALEAWRAGPLAVLKALARGTSWAHTQPPRALPASTQYLLWLAHAGGLVYLYRLGGYRYREAILLGLAWSAALLSLQLPSLLRRQAPDATVLSPMFVPYVIAAAWRLGLLPPVGGQALLRFAALGAGVYAALVQVERSWRARARGGLLSPAVPLLLVGLGAWVVLVYLGARTSGVTGSDPYCYAQMAVDLARRADPRHIFTLFPLIRDLGIPWWPVVHVGYYPPSGPIGQAAAVWPVGWPVLLAIGYRLLGESGLYITAPITGLLSLIVTACLALEVLPQGHHRERWLGVALAALILATSREQVLQLLVPMADVPAQLFSALAVWAALRSSRKVSWPLAAVSGVALGAAYNIRHTQVFLAPVVALALWPVGGPIQRWRLLFTAGAAACLAAAPDLWYHRLAFGSVWRTESPELNLISWRYWWANARRMAAALAAWAEFGPFLPLLAYGLWRLWRGGRTVAAVLLSWVLINAGTQFLYGPLRWRDLLTILPPLAILTAHGTASLIGSARRKRQLADWAPGWLALGVALLLAVRSGPMLRWPFEVRELTFGYLTAEQRRAFDVLGGLVESQAVIGSSLNSGPIELYTGRETFRPGDWSPAELDVFLEAMSQAGRVAYILDDGNEQAQVVARLRGEGRLVPVWRLKVPLYGDRSQLSGELYRVRAQAS